MIDDPKGDPKWVCFPPDMIQFANIYTPINFFEHHPDWKSRDQFTFTLTFDPRKVSYSDGGSGLLPYVYDSAKRGPQLRLRAFARPPVLTPGQPAAWLPQVINVLDGQNRKRDDVFKYADNIQVAVRPWSQLAMYGPYKGSLITGLSIDHVDLYGLKPEKLGI